MLWENLGRAWERAAMALSPLCSHLLDSLVSPLGQPVTAGSRFLPTSALKPCGCVDAHPSCGWPHSHAVLLLPGYQPLSFRSCSYRGLDTKTQPFSPFPHAKPTGALGQCASPLWAHRVTQGTSNLSTSGAHRGCQGQSVCPHEVMSEDPLNCNSFTPRSFTPAWGGHKPASTSTPQLSFLQLLAGAGPSASPGAAQVLPRVCALPPPGTASRPAGGTYLHALCVFLSERRGGR